MFCIVNLVSDIYIYCLYKLQIAIYVIDVSILAP